MMNRHDLSCDDLNQIAGLFPNHLLNPSWDDFSRLPALELRAVVALSVGLDPLFANVKWAIGRMNKPISQKDGVASCLEAFVRRLGITEHNVEPYGFLKILEPADTPQCHKIRLVDFAEFANRMKWSLPDEFPRQEITQEVKPTDQATEEPCNGMRWPWGGHETDLLRQLAAAAENFWVLYDPADPSTAPTNRQVKDWLIKRNVADRVAEIMAQILRADGLPSGPRK